MSDYTPQEHADYIRRAIEDMPPVAFETIWAERELLLESLDVIEASARAAGSATDALRQGVEIASQFMNTGRGDLDGWIDFARETLAVLASPAAADEERQAG